jgi:hypothetical protein
MSFFTDTLHELADMRTCQLVVHNAPLSAAHDQL